MSEPRLISPMLDGFALGGSISTHSGVSCYPAMRNDSDERYIVKAISIPASQVQLEALLLTGAYPDADAAAAYFRERTEEIRDEVEILNKLAAQRGFLPYDDHQIVPMEEGVGYEIYMISPYKPTLERKLKRSPMTHLSAVNMGIDLCAALAVCREAGYLYVDLKPGNIFLTGPQEFYLGDLGFVSTRSLKFASLPDRYRSAYTPPEVADAYATLNTTMDIYALGLVLYQVYNNGQLPFDSEQSRKELMQKLAAGESLPAPAYADYEMAEIILKACAYSPEDRWQTPAEMGHALISYMQRNGANDEPIVPPVVEIPEPEEPEEPEESQETETSGEGESTEEAVPVTAEDEDALPPPIEIPEEEPEEASEPQVKDWIDRMDEYLAEDEQAEDTQEEDSDTPTLRQLLGSSVFTDDAEEEVGTDGLSDDTASILNQAQELIDHEAPEPVVAPEPIDIPMPDPIVLPDNDGERDENGLLTEEESGSLPADDSDEEAADTSEGAPALPRRKINPRTVKRVIGWILALVLLAGIGAGGYYYYNNYYLQTIDDLSVGGRYDQLTVTVDTSMDQSLLTVVCTDQHGYRQESGLTDGTATFTNLTPGTQYMVTLEVEGFHQLTGFSPVSYSTPNQTQILGLSAVTGSEDGSAVLNFSVEGPESQEWVLDYVTEGEESKTMTFSGHSVTVTGLTVGKTYTFTLNSTEEIYLAGSNSCTFTAAAVVYAQDLLVSGYGENSMTLTWTPPEGAEVSGWVARCYNEEGYDQSIEVTENTVTFENISMGTPYTVDVIAVGMTQGTRVNVTANPITISAVNAEVVEDSINVTWEFVGSAPEGDWLVLYTVDNGTEQLIQTSEPTAVISPIAPGSHYDITIRSTDDTSVFGGSGSVDVPDNGSFAGYGISASEISVMFFQVPAKENWTLADVGAATTTFAPGENVAVMFRTYSTYNIDYADITTTFVVRDETGAVAAISSSVRSWAEMWEGGYCQAEMTGLPSIPGTYTMQIYFDNALVAEETVNIQ